MRAAVCFAVDPFWPGQGIRRGRTVKRGYKKFLRTDGPRTGFLQYTFSRRHRDTLQVSVSRVGKVIVGILILNR